MDYMKRWKPTKIHKRIKLGKFCKKPAKLCKALIRPLFRKLFRRAVPRRGRQPHNQDHNLAFMVTCVVKVNPSKKGWQKGVLAVLRNCKGLRFKMDQNGVVEVSGIGDTNKLLDKLGRSTKVELHWFQSGQCSSNLVIPAEKKKVETTSSSSNPPYYSFPRYRGAGYGYYPSPRPVGYGYHHPQVQNQYGYHYQRPQIFRQFLPF